MYAATARERSGPPVDGLRRVHLGMIDAVLAGEGTGRVATLAARELDGTVAIVLPAAGVAVVAPRSGARQLPAARRYVGDRLLGVRTPAPDGLVCEVPVVSGDERLGAALLLGDRAQPQAGDVLQLAALAVLTATTLEQGAAPSRARAASSLLESLRADRPEPAEIVARAARLRCDLSQGATALAVAVAPSATTHALATIAEQAPDALAARVGDRVLALVPSSATPPARLVRRLRPHAPTGIAPLQRDVARLGRALRFAELAMLVGAQEQVAPDELLVGSWRVLLCMAAEDADEIDTLVAATIGPILDPAVRPSLDLLTTLRAYLAHDGRIGGAAQAIHAHRHTVAYRLERLAELTGHDPQTADGHAQLCLGLRALALQRALRSAAPAPRVSRPAAGAAPP